MKVLYRTYDLNPLKSANRMSGMDAKTGVHLKVSYAGGVNFADYFPHRELGDRSCEEFLESFKYQDHEYEQKVFYFLLNDHTLRTQDYKKFLNHELWTPVAPPKCEVIKYKIQHKEDFSFSKLLETKTRVRLDANGLFSVSEAVDFLSQIKHLHLIEYMEDPSLDTNWPDTGPWARDFIQGKNYQFIIHKSQSRLLPKEDKKIIFSSYLGSSLGLWQTYCELIKAGDLSEHHGLITPGFYKVDLDIFTGDYKQGFAPDMEVVKKMYREMDSSEWKVLCSI